MSATLSSTQILEKAIQKAIDGGWESAKEIDIEPYGPNYYHIHYYGEEMSHAELLFNHGFAKALWGTEETKDHYGGEVEFYDFGGEDWQYHLMCMVVADDPIKYLGDNI